MKVRIKVSSYDYMGLPSGTVVDAEYLGETLRYRFRHAGKTWTLDADECSTVLEGSTHTDIVKPIKSDGGSSAYYDFKVPQHYLDLIAETGIIKTEYLIDIIFGNDFDFACTFKALVRAKGITDGAGKEGNTLDYELNKMNYYESKIKEKYGWKNG